MLLYVYYIGLLKRFRVYYYKALYKYCILLLLLLLFIRLIYTQRIMRELGDMGVSE